MTLSIGQRRLLPSVAGCFTAYRARSAAPGTKSPAAKCHGFRVSFAAMAASASARRLLFAAALAACACVRNSAPELVGKWSSRETAPDGVHGTSATYDFKANGTFEMTGYPPIEVKGRW